MKISRRCLHWIIAVLALVVFLGVFSWYKFFREVDQPAFANEDERFKYGSVGAEFSRGLPYWVWLVLPRIFPDYLPGPGGYQSFGLVWEPGKELPVGFSKKTVGFPRVANNCAICHVGTWRANDRDLPHLVVAAPAHTTDIQGMIRFLTRCAEDPRFNSSTLLTEIERETKLSFIDKQLYRFAIIPLTRSALKQQGKQFTWMNRPHWPNWGKGRDDPMNLTKYFMTAMAVDNSTGQADFPSIWNLKTRSGPGLYLNWSCDTPAVRSVLIDSALGLGAAPDRSNPIDRLNWSWSRRSWFEKRMDALVQYLSDLPPPKYPFSTDASLLTRGKTVYTQNCAACHEPGQKYTNKPVPISDVATDRERMDTWIQSAADEANRRVKEMGISRPDMVKQEGYQGIPLDGIWMRAPYLHNGSVPNLRELLEPADRRSKVFYRGYDVYDSINVGFVSSGENAQRAGFKLDVSERGNGNQGHLYGTTLPKADKDALVEYLKTL